MKIDKVTGDLIRFCIAVSAIILGLYGAMCENI